MVVATHEIYYSDTMVGFYTWWCSMDAILGNVGHAEHEGFRGSLTIAVFFKSALSVDSVSYIPVL